MLMHTDNHDQHIQITNHEPKAVIIHGSVNQRADTNSD